MARAQNHRDRSHARIYAHWRRYPAWTTLSLAARCTLVEMLLENRLGNNGHCAWPCRKIASLLGIGKDSAARALIELECRGWIVCTRVAGFSRRNVPATYALTMFPNDANGDAATNGFEVWEEEREVAPRVAPQGHDSRNAGTQASHRKDTARVLALPDRSAPSTAKARKGKALRGNAARPVAGNKLRGT